MVTHATMNEIQKLKEKRKTKRKKQESKRDGKSIGTEKMIQ